MTMTRSDWHRGSSNGQRDARRWRETQEDRKNGSGYRWNDVRDRATDTKRGEPLGGRQRSSHGESRRPRADWRAGNNRSRSRSYQRRAPYDDRDTRRRGDPSQGRYVKDAQRQLERRPYRMDQEKRHKQAAPNGQAGRDRRSLSRRRRGASRVRSFDSTKYSDSSRSQSPAAADAKKSAGDSDNDEIIHFDWVKSAMLAARYKVIKFLGDGTFGRVLLAHDQRENRDVAIKVIRDVKRYAENAQIESDILADIRRADPRGEASRSAIMYDTFWHQKHICLVLEPCGVSLYDFMKTNNYRGFFMQDVQSFASQSLEALAFLHGQLKLTHTDLKPENILLEAMEPPTQIDFPRQDSQKDSSKYASYVRPANSRIRLIDFGNATYSNEHHSSIINTRQYRGPEVVLNLGWNERSDIWSLGCILMELYTGELLFGTHDNLEHLALMERVLDYIPSTMLNSAPKSVKDKYIVSKGAARLQWPEKAVSTSSEKHVRNQLRLEDLVSKQHQLFAKFVGHLLTIDPDRRPSAPHALEHSLFSKSFSD